MAFGDIIQEAVLDGASSATVEATFADNPVEGNLIVAAAHSGDGALTIDIGTLILSVGNTDTGQDDGHAIAHRKVQAADGKTWGFNQPSADQFEIILREVEGPWSDDLVDQTGNTAHADNDVTVSATAAGAVDQDDEFVVASWSYRTLNGFNQTISFTGVDNSFINLLEEVNDNGGAGEKCVAMATKILTAGGTPTVLGTLSASSSTNFRAGACLVTYRKEAGGAADPEGSLLRGKLLRGGLLMRGGVLLRA